MAEVVDVGRPTRQKVMNESVTACEIHRRPRRLNGKDAMAVGSDAGSIV